MVIDRSFVIDNCVPGAKVGQSGSFGSSFGLFRSFTLRVGIILPDPPLNSEAALVGVADLEPRPWRAIASPSRLVCEMSVTFRHAGTLKQSYLWAGSVLLHALDLYE